MERNNTGASNTRSRKDEVRDILVKRDFVKLLEWAKKTRNPIRTLTSFQFDPEPLICMRSVEALGRVATLYNDDLEVLRKMVRRLFWMMNDESGNVGWYAAEAIGETLRNVPMLIAEYAGMLPSFLIEEPFEKGTRIAIARIAEIDKSQFNIPTCKKLISSLSDPSPEIRGSSIIALKALCVSEAEEHIAALVDDNTEITLYDFDTGEMKSVTIGNLANDLGY